MSCRGILDNSAKDRVTNECLATQIREGITASSTSAVDGRNGIGR